MRRDLLVQIQGGSFKPQGIAMRDGLTARQLGFGHQLLDDAAADVHPGMQPRLIRRAVEMGLARLPHHQRASVRSLALSVDAEGDRLVEYHQQPIVGSTRPIN